jgi:hypothetical protein
MRVKAEEILHAIEYFKQNLESIDRWHDYGMSSVL